MLTVSLFFHFLSSFNSSVARFTLFAVIYFSTVRELAAWAIVFATYIFSSVSTLLLWLLLLFFFLASTQLYVWIVEV